MKRKKNNKGFVKYGYCLNYSQCRDVQNIYNGFHFTIEVKC